MPGESMHLALATAGGVCCACLPSVFVALAEVDEWSATLTMRAALVTCPECVAIARQRGLL